MRIGRIVILLIFLFVVFSTAAYATEANFSASSLTASNVNCKKCHADSPHVIHANKPVECVACHGDKLSVSTPKCTKCHDGPIHKVHAGKVATQTCSYCHKTITDVHNNLMKDAVCSHCHKDLIEVHGKDAACVKCHKSPPDIVKPIKSPEMILICQDCHAATSVATIHAPIDEKKGCYECHKGTSQANGSEIPHQIHASLVDCKGCHQENNQVVVPRCTRCHDIDKLHAFSTIGKLTSETGLTCSACHTDETKLSAPQQTKKAPQQQKPANTSPAGTARIQNASQTTKGATEKIPGFGVILVGIGMILALAFQRK